MKFFFAAVLIFILSGNALAQRAKVYSFKVTLGGDTVYLPQVKVADTNVEQRINYYLQMMLLNVIAPPNHLREGIRSRLWTDSTSGMSSLTYKVVRNDSKILSIGTDEEYEAAYPSAGQDQITFDVLSGLPVTGKDIFTADGLKKITSMISHDRLALVEKNNKAMEEDTIDKIDSDDKESIEDALIQCAEDSLHVLMNSLLISDSLFTPDPTGCLPHVEQGYDIDWTVSFPINSLSGYLNAYGKGLLLDQPYHPDSSSASPFVLLKGTIDGRYPIIMMLQDDNFEDDIGFEVHGQYFYAQKGIPIRIGGRRVGRTLSLEEERYDEQPMAGFSGQYSSGGYKGIWHSAKGDKKLKFELTRF